MSMDHSEMRDTVRHRNRESTEKVLKIAIEQSELAHDTATRDLFDFLDELQVAETDRNRLRAKIVAYVGTCVARAATGGALKAVRIV